MRAFLLLLFLGTLLGACGKDSTQSREEALEEYAQSHGLDVDVTLDDADDGTPEVTIRTGQGAVVGGDLALPDGFPDDIAMHPAIKLYASAPVPGGYSLSGRSTANSEEIIAFFSEEMPRRGWSQKPGGAQSPAMQSVQFEKGTRIAGVTVLATGQEKAVQIMTMDMAATRP